MPARVLLHHRCSRCRCDEFMGCADEAALHRYDESHTSQAAGHRAPGAASSIQTRESRPPSPFPTFLLTRARHAFFYRAPTRFPVTSAP